MSPGVGPGNFGGELGGVEDILRLFVFCLPGGGDVPRFSRHVSILSDQRVVALHTSAAAFIKLLDMVPSKRESLPNGCLIKQLRPALGPREKRPQDDAKDDARKDEHARSHPQIPRRDEHLLSGVVLCRSCEGS